MLRYDTIRNEMKDGDIILWRGNGLVARLIRLKEYYTHVSFIFEFKKGDVRRVLLYESLAKGVIPTFLSARIRKYNGSFYWCKLRKKYTGKRNLLFEKANEYGGTGYDFKSLFRNIFRYVSADAEKLFCSEFVYVAGVDAGLNRYKKLKAPRPDDLLKLDWFEVPIEFEYGEEND